MIAPVRLDGPSLVPTLSPTYDSSRAEAIRRQIAQIQSLLTSIHEDAKRGHDYTDKQTQLEHARTELQANLKAEIDDEAKRSGLDTAAAGRIVQQRYQDPEVDGAVERIDSEQALADVKTAEDHWSQGAQTRQQDDSRTAQLSDARRELKEAVKAEGAEAILARHPNDPAVRTQVAQAELDLAEDNLAAQEAKIPNLGQVKAQDQGASENGMMKNLRGADGQPISMDQYKQLVQAREQVMVKRTELQHALNDRVLDMRGHGMSREDALKQLRNEDYGAALGFTSDSLENGQMPTTIGMTDAERSAYYEKNFLDNPATSEEARKAYESGQPVIFAIHHDDALDVNGGTGLYNDRFVVLQKTDGKVTAREFDASVDPNTSYGIGSTQSPYDLPGSAPDGQVGQYAKNDTPWYSMFTTYDWHRTYAPTRLADGQTIQLATGPDGQQTDGWGTLEKLYTPSGGGYKLQGDLNGDGIFGNDGQYATKTADSNEFQLHAGKADYSHTGTDGCVTVPVYQWNDFRAAIGLFNGSPDQRINQPGNIYYVQVSEHSLHG